MRNNHSWDCDGDRGSARTCLPMNSPKHLMRHNNSMSHCCFAGCTPRGCEGRCCVQEFGHRADCPSNVWRIFDEQQHAIYVQNGGRKHLKPEPRRCVSCREELSSSFFNDNGSCGPSGCLNRQA